MAWCRARRFAARAGAVDNQDGFEGFELLKPSDERTTWLVVTRWRDQASFDAWLRSPAFGHGHRSAAECGGGEASAPGRHRVAAPATSLSRCRRFNALFVPLRGYGA
jgi:heme-degrading monooxygenase HmoA